MQKIALRTAGTIFLLVAIAHLGRLIVRPQIMVGNFVVPLWPSAVAFVAILALAIWMFKSAK